MITIGKKLAIAQGNALALCETSSTTIRVHKRNDEALMRAYNRRPAQVWMNDTEAEIQITADGIEYTNLLGELATLKETGRTAI